MNVSSHYWSPFHANDCIFSRNEQQKVYVIAGFQCHAIQSRSIDEVQNLGMKGGTYTKTLAKTQVRGIFRIRDLRRNVLRKLIEICMQAPRWCSPV